MFRRAMRFGDRATWFSAVCLIGTSCVSAADDKGLDVVLLVDVSGSMHEHFDRASQEIHEGNDPTRLRWDAVKLVLDLLTAEDRIVVLPFNAHCPAKTTLPGGTREIPVPGLLPSVLQPVDAKTQETLGRQILDFIHSEKRRGDASEAWNGDQGATAILGSLGTAKTKIEEGRTGAKRQAVVILLTDGKEQTSPDGKSDPDEIQVQTGTWKHDERVQFFVSQSIPIHTIGLGTDVDRDFLNGLATLTGGSATYVETNLVLVETFRELVWSLRDCWTAKVELKEIGTGGFKVSSGPLDQAMDLGILVYEEDRTQVQVDQPRIAFAPEPLPLVELRGGPPVEVRPRTGKRIATIEGDQRDSGYAYYYFDGRLRPESPLGQLFRQNPEIEAILTFQSESRQRNIYGHFIKRGQRFRIELANSRFYRHEPILLRVVMADPGPGMRASNYIAKAELMSDQPVPPAATGQEVVSVQLAAVSETGFECALESPLTAEELWSPSNYEQLDDYVLRVTLEGRQTTGTALSSYRHVMPLRNLQIENGVLLQTNELVIMNRSTPREKIDVHSVHPLRGLLPLRVEYELPRPDDTDAAPVPPEAFQFVSLPRAKREGELVMEDGKLSLGIALNLQKLPPGSYTGGEIRLSAQPGSLPIVSTNRSGTRNTVHVIPFEVHLGTVGINLAWEDESRRPRPLTVGPERSLDVQSLTVTLLDPDADSEGIDPPTLEIVSSQEGPQAFSADELFFRRSDGTRVGQQCGLAVFGESVEIVFQPDASSRTDPADLIGTHAYMLRAYGPGVDEVQVPLGLVVEPPAVEAQAVDLTGWQTHPGAELPAIRHEVRLRWLPNASLSFALRPEDTIPMQSAEGRLHPFPYRNVSSPITLQSVSAEGPAEAGWKNLEFSVTVPELGKVPFGPLQGELMLRFEDRDFQTLPFHFTIDGLYVSYPLPADAKTGKELDVPQRTSQIAFNQFFDHPRTVRIGLYSELEEKLDHTCVEIQLLGPRLADGRGPYLMKRGAEDRVSSVPDFLPPPLLPGPDSIRQHPDGKGLIVEFQFPPVINAQGDGQSPYCLDVALRYGNQAAGADLGEAPLSFELHVLDPRKLFRFEDTEP